MGLLAFCIVSYNELLLHTRQKHLQILARRKGTSDEEAPDERVYQVDPSGRYENTLLGTRNEHLAPLEESTNLVETLGLESETLLVGRVKNCIVVCCWWPEQPHLFALV